jgi:hypothetical protein
LDNHDCLFPVGHAANQHHQSEAITPIEVRTSDVTVHDDELLAQQGILHNQFSFAAREVGEDVPHK